MADDKLKSFKIGDSQRPTAAPVTQKGDQPASEESVTLGFARIENMLEKEDPVAIGENLNTLLKNLEELQSTVTTNKEKLAAKKAIAAVERAVDLMDFLFQTKTQLESNASE